MGKFITHEQVEIRVDGQGNGTERRISTSTSIVRNDEPDYIKIYTNMWCEMNGIPVTYRELFLQLAMRMTYCNFNNLKDSQIVHVSGSTREDLEQTLNWKSTMLTRGLTVLCRCGAIKRVRRGEYQINPKYAGKGEWKYNPKLKRGGVKELFGTFNLKNKTLTADIIWENVDPNTEIETVATEKIVMEYTDFTDFS